MVMDTIQIRLSKGVLDLLDRFVKEGLFSSRSDFIRDAIRRRMDKLILNKMVGLIPNNGKDSVEEVREIRKQLAKEKFDLDEINKLAD